MTSIKDSNRTQRFIDRAYRAFFTPGENETRPEDVDVLAAGRTYRLDTTSGALVVTGWGETGPSVLLVHGWGGSRAQMAGFVRPLLDSHFRVVAFDQPAHGDSGGQTNILEITAAMDDLVSREDPFYAVIAHSFGTLVTSYAITHRAFPLPERIVFLGAFNRLLDSLPRFQALSGLPDPIIAGIRAKIDVEFGVGVLEPIVNAELVRTIDVPALLFHDNQDEVTPVEDSRTIAQAWPSARLVETGGLGHHGALRSAEVQDQILHFLNS